MNLIPHEPILLVPLAALGLVFGSFVTALSYRLPRGESVAHGRSRCSACGHTLTASDLVPVLSWIAQGGACRYCRTKVPWRYPAIEVVSMALFVVAGLLARDTSHLIMLLAMTPAMIALAVIDLEHQRLPNGLVIVLVFLALAWRWSGDRALVNGLITAIAAVAAGWLMDRGFKSLAGKSGLGMGDTKLFALAGLALPLGPFLLFVGLAGVLGGAFGGLWRWRTGSRQFPFAPAILVAYWACLAQGEQLLQRFVIYLSG